MKTTFYCFILRCMTKSERLTDVYLCKPISLAMALVCIRVKIENGIIELASVKFHINLGKVLLTLIFS